MKVPRHFKLIGPEGYEKIGVCPQYVFECEGQKYLGMRGMVVFKGINPEEIEKGNEKKIVLTKEELQVVRILIEDYES